MTRRVPHRAKTGLHAGLVDTAANYLEIDENETLKTLCRNHRERRRPVVNVSRSSSLGLSGAQPRNRRTAAQSATPAKGPLAAAVWSVALLAAQALDRVKCDAVRAHGIASESRDASWAKEHRAGGDQEGNDARRIAQDRR